MQIANEPIELSSSSLPKPRSPEPDLTEVWKDIRSAVDTERGEVMCGVCGKESTTMQFLLLHLPECYGISSRCPFSGCDYMISPEDLQAGLLHLDACEFRTVRCETCRRGFVAHTEASHSCTALLLDEISLLQAEQSSQQSQIKESSELLDKTQKEKEEIQRLEAAHEVTRKNHKILICFLIAVILTLMCYITYLVVENKELRNNLRFRHDDSERKTKQHTYNLVASNDYLDKLYYIAGPLAEEKVAEVSPKFVELAKTEPQYHSDLWRRNGNHFQLMIFLCSKPLEKTPGNPTWQKLVLDTTSSQNTTTYYEGEVIDGKPNGFGRLVTYDYEVHEGLFKKGKLNGFGRKFRKNPSWVEVGDFETGAWNATTKIWLNGAIERQCPFVVCNY